ncbi:MAG TPA: cytochrome c-type biogenesis protein CcmH [Gaiellaceae bacterium]|nr:cytochrome c-type biogenesis protein CcmH [Gaiellaceae bacterium]
MRRLLLVLAAVLALAAPALASEQHPTQQELEAALVCPTCHVPLDESTAPIAQQMKQEIRVDIAKGWTRSRILDAFVADYGSSVLSEPQTHGFDLVAWVLPIGGACLGVVALGAAAVYWSRTRRDGPAPATAGEPPLDPELERRVDEELARFDG